jgi:hypothetical protein
VIVDVALVPDSLAELSFSRLNKAALVAQTSCIKALLAHGALVFSSSDEIRDLVHLVGDPSLFSPEEGKRWKEMLLTLRAQGRITDRQVVGQRLKDVGRITELSEFLSHQGENVFVLPEPQFDRLFTSQAMMATVDQMNTVAVASTFAESDAVKRYRDRAEIESHPYEYSRDLIWDELFDSLCRRSKEIVIFDQYLLGRLAKRDLERGHLKPPEHLVWLLDKLRSNAPLGTVVKLYGGYGDARNPLVPSSAEGAMNLIMRHWVSSPGRIVELHVHIARWTPRLPHARHIRFNDLGFYLDAGLDRLASPTVWDEGGFPWKYAWREPAVEAMKNDELRVSRDSSTKTFNVQI